MRKLKLFIPILTGLLTLSSCNVVFFPIDDGNDSEIKIESEKPGEDEVVKSTKVVDLNSSNYYVGNNFVNDSDLVVRYTYQSGKIYDEKLLNPTINMIKYVDENISLNKTDSFQYAGNYKVSVSYQYEGTKTTILTFEVKSGVLSNDLTLKSFTLKDPINYTIGKKLSETNLTYTFNAEWTKKNETNPIIETISYRQHTDLIELSLVKKGTTTNVYDSVLEGDTDYVFSANLVKYPSIKASSSFLVSSKAGYYKLNKSNLVYSEFTDASVSEGESSMIVILIDMEPGSSKYKTYDWTTQNKQKVNNYFFGEKSDTPSSWNSLKTYYQQASNNKINITGKVFEPYPSTYTVAEITDSNRPTLLNNAVKYVKQQNPTMDWSTYDRNKDGYFDNLHFITNLYMDGIEWSDPLWPHQSALRASGGTASSPVGNVYEITTFGMFTDARTVIHEQGHMFGLPDYYDYSYSGADYVGYLDMQSNNVMDWNSWSKFAVGWANPIVVDGELDDVTIQFNSASTTNECVIIPANHSTYNGSAFDEFFLIELITAEGNNKADWEKYLSQSVKAGVRIYHVDARLWCVNNQTILDDPSEAKQLADRGYYIDLRTSNTTTFGEYAGYNREEDHDFKTLCLIQAGGVDTFGKQNGSSNTTGHQLTIDDLFQKGDVFTFAKYKHFLSKSGKTVSKMDNGETFPYTITFQYVGLDGCTIRVTK